MPPFRINEAVEKAIYDFAVAALGITVIWDKQDAQEPGRGHKPDLPFATLNIISGPLKEGNAEERRQSDGVYEYPMRRIFTVQVQVFAKSDHMGKLGDFADAFELETKAGLLRAAGIAVRLVGDPLDISAFLETGHELRGTLDVDMAYAKTVTDNVGQIENVHATGTIGDLAVDITIPA